MGTQLLSLKYPLKLFLHFQMLRPELLQDLLALSYLPDLLDLPESHRQRVVVIFWLLQPWVRRA